MPLVGGDIARKSDDKAGRCLAEQKQGTVLSEDMLTKVIMPTPSIRLPTSVAKRRDAYWAVEAIL